MKCWKIDAQALNKRDKREHLLATLTMPQVAGVQVIKIMDSARPSLFMAVGADTCATAQTLTARKIATGFTIALIWAPDSIITFCSGSGVNSESCAMLI